MRTYKVKITGKSPLLMHNDNIAWADDLRRWRESNQKKSVAGDDRSPAFTWIGSVYHDGSRLVVPSDNIMRALMEGGAQVVVPGGKRGKTYKTQTQSGMVTGEEAWPLTVDGREIQLAPIARLQTVEDFEEHCRVAKDLGFELYMKRARIGQSKHIRVRPRFHRWAASGTLQVWDEQITTKALGAILEAAGDNKGIGDWRPSSKTPGPFGRFSVEVEEV